MIAHSGSSLVSAARPNYLVNIGHRMEQSSVYCHSVGNKDHNDIHEARSGTLFVVGPHHAGDTLICLLALAWILEHRSFSRVSMVANNLIAPLLKELMDIPEVIECPPGYIPPFIAPAWHGARLGMRLRSHRYDELLDFRGDLISAAIMCATKARVRRGSDYRTTRFFSTHGFHPMRPIQWAHDYYAQLAAFSIESEPPTVKDLLRIGRKLGDGWCKSSGSGERSDILLCPGASIMPKQWPMERWAHLAKALVSLGHKVTFLIAQNELALVNEVRRMGLPTSVDFFLSSSVIESAKVLRGAMVAVTCDSLASHLAFILSTPVVTIFGPTSSETWFPYHSIGAGIAVCLSGLPECHPCQRHRCLHREPCIWGIEVHAVLAAIEHIVIDVARHDCSQ